MFFLNLIEGPDAYAQVAKSEVNILVTAESIRGDSCRFVALNDSKTFEFAADDETLTVPTDQLIWWNGPVDSVDQPLIRLVDGSVVVGQPTFVDGNEIEITSNVWRIIRLPMSDIESIFLQIPANPGARDRRQQHMMMEPLTQTRVWLTNGDVLYGDFSGVLSGNELALTSENRLYRLPMESISSIAFAVPGTDRSATGIAPVFEFSLSDGSRLRATKIEVNDERLNVECGGLALTFEKKQTLETGMSVARMVCGIRNLKFDPQYLSQREPEKYEHQPMLGRRMNYRFNQSVIGTNIRFGKTAFPFGIGMPSRSNLVFRTDNASDESWLEFGVAMDPSTGERGDALCQILILDRNNEWRKHSWSARIRGSDSDLVFHRIHLGSCRAVALTVDYSSDADILDRVNWIMPRLFESSGPDSDSGK